MSERLTLALPIDLARSFDHTVTQTQLQNNTFQGTPDDRDTLAGFIEDAEDEFREQTDAKMRASRIGVTGRRETYEHLTYEVSGHRAFKRTFSRVGSNYLPTEVTKSLDNKRVLPFDPDAGDEAYFYRGLGGARSDSGVDSGWEDVTDAAGDTWSIVDHTSGTVVFHPIELARAMTSSGRGVSMHGGRLRELRLAISYRYGSLGGSRGSASQTTLAADLSEDETGTVAVEDGSGVPGGSTYVVLVGEEYVEVEPDPGSDEVRVVSRGLRGTQEASHESGDRVQYTPPSVRKAVACRAGMSLVQSGRYSGWLPDEDDSISKSDLLDRLKETWETTLEAMS